MTVKSPQTLGEAVERNGVPLAMDCICRLAEAHGRIPVGFWEVALRPDWTLTVNGTNETRDGIPPYRSKIVGVNALGWPVVAIIDPCGGSMIGVTEDELISVLEAAIAKGQP